MKGIGRRRVWVGVSLCLLAGLGWADGEWRSEVVFSRPEGLGEIVIGEGRNDGKARIYIRSADVVQELTYSNGAWHVDTVCIPENGSNIGLCLTDGRNDGIMRVYIIADTSDPCLWEYTYVDGEWIGVPIGEIRTDLSLGIHASPGRNDDSIRLYCSSYEITEFTYTREGWRIRRLGDTTQRFDLLELCEGRNDDTIRLYGRRGKDWYEWTFSGGEWRQERIDIEGGVFTTMGNGRNDGINRFYIHVPRPLYEIYTIEEYTWFEGAWVEKRVDEIHADTGLPTYMYIGQGRNDDTFRLYCIDRDRSCLYEYTWRHDHWERRDIPIPKPSIYNKAEESILQITLWHRMTRISIGEGRGDGTNRIYLIVTERPGWRSPATLIELTYIGLGVEEGHLTEGPFLLRLAPNPTYEGVCISYWVDRPQEVTLAIYDASGRKVRLLDEGYKERGKYDLFWSGCDESGRRVGSGVYFCWLKAGDRVTVKKITLLR